MSDGGPECLLEAGYDGRWVYAAPGCGENQPAPMCVGGDALCIRYACSCAGKVIDGCTVYFEPYAYTFCSVGQCNLADIPARGADCDPNAY